MLRGTAETALLDFKQTMLQNDFIWNVSCTFRNLVRNPLLLSAFPHIVMSWNVRAWTLPQYLVNRRFNSRFEKYDGYIQGIQGWVLWWYWGCNPLLAMSYNMKYVGVFFCSVGTSVEMVKWAPRDGAVCGSSSAASRGIAFGRSRHM